MLTNPPKDLRENIARANGYLRRSEVERALTCMSSALRQYAGVRLVRSARAVLDIQINEFLASLIHHQKMQPLLDPGNNGKPRAIPYQPGKEGALATVLGGLAKILRDEAEDSIRRETEARLERKKTLIQTGVRLMSEGQTAKGRAFLKRVAEEFSDEKGIHIQLAQLFVAAGQHMEAAEMYEQAIEAQPRETAAYAGAVTAWQELHEYEKAENIYKAILRTFGGHPSTLGRMAKMYLDWRRRAQAEDTALRALQGDPKQADALAVMAALHKN